MVGSAFPDPQTLDARCPMLGHPVTFVYCRECSDGLPCRKVIDCWSGKMDVAEYLKFHYTEEEIARILAPPKPKLAQIIELARKASGRKS